MSEFERERELIIRSIECVPYLDRTMKIDNYAVYGSLVRRLIEVCVVGKRVLTTEEATEWLKTHDIDILVTKAESAKELVEFLSTVKESYSYNGYDYTNDNNRVPQSTDWEKYKFKVGNHTYHLKGGVKFDVSISNGRAHSIGVDFTCNSFKVRYVASDVAYNRRYNDDVGGYVREKARDEYCRFNLVCNWRERSMENDIKCVVERKIQLANRVGNVKIWYRMVKLTECGYSVDYEKSEELVDFALLTLTNFYHSIITYFFEGGNDTFITIEGVRVHVKNVFCNPRIQSIILKAFVAIPIEKVFLKVLKYSSLFEILKKKWYAELVSDITHFNSSESRGETIEEISRRIIRKFRDISDELSEYNVVIDKIYSKTTRRPDLLESVKCLCFIFKYLYNLFMWKNKQQTFEEFIKNIAESSVEERSDEECNEDNMLDFTIYHENNGRSNEDLLNFAKLRNISEIYVGENDEYEVIRVSDSYGDIKFKYTDIGRQLLEDEIVNYTNYTLFPTER